MKNPRPLDRRRFLGRAAAGIAVLTLGGCDQLSQSPWVVGLLDSAERATRYMQRLITGRNALAREYTEADLSPVFRANGTT
ncbi:MAG: twin-arginine translocation signal domain-containing protein, partial [Stellaceae bacterium]